MFGIGKKKDQAKAPSAAPMAEMQPAGFWLRVVAFIVDYALLLILGGAMMMGAASAGGEEMVGPVYWLWVLLTFLYWPVLESTARRATVGKGLLGLVVADVDGGRLSFVRSLLRNLAKIISSIPFGIGFLLAAFTGRKQALHDLITKAVVLRQSASSFAKALGVLAVGIVLLIAGSYLAFDHMMGAVMNDLQAMVSGETPMPAKPSAMPKPAAKPAPAPVAKPAAPAAAPAPVAAAKPAPAPVAPAPAPAPAAAPEPAPAPAAKPAAAAPAPKPAAVPVLTPKPAPKAPAMEEPKPAPRPPVVSARPRAESLQQLSGPGSGPPPVSPKFNDVMTAVVYRDREAVSQLLDLGRWADKRDSNGLTPLMIAVVGRDAAMVQLLLERGADQKLQAPGGAVALDLAREAGDGAVESLLLKPGAR
jgi:uncharacterized RDD family membrane protein YckC